MQFVIVACALLALVLPIGADTFSVNPGFEVPLILNATPAPYQVFDPLIKSYLQADVPGWTTTDSNGAIEIWRSGAQGFMAYEGQQWAEINAYSPATLTTHVTPTSGTQIGVWFAHRGRNSALVADVMRAVVTDLGTLPGSGDDIVLHTGDYLATNVAWIFHTIPLGFATGNQLRLDLTAVSTAGGNPSVGNFIDAVAFGNTPEPSTYVLVLAGLALIARLKRHR